MATLFVKVDEVQLNAGLLKLLILPGGEKTLKCANYISDASQKIKVFLFIFLSLSDGGLGNIKCLWNGRIDIHHAHTYLQLNIVSLNPIVLSCAFS